MIPLQINEFLCFLTVQLDNMNRDNLISALQDGFTYIKAVEAKDILIAECQKASISDSIKDYTVKRVEGKSGALRRVVTDAVDIWTVIDREIKGKILV